MVKRIISAFILSSGRLYAFRALYAPTEPAPSPGTTAPAPITTPAPKQEPTKTAESTETAEPVAAPVGDVHSDKTENLVVDTPLYTATISNVGGVLTSYKLKAFSDGKGQPLELINTTAGAKVGWPLAVESDDKTLNQSLSKALFVPRRDGDRVVLEYADGGVHARKELQFDGENYEFSLRSVLAKDGKNVTNSVVWQSGFGEQ